VGTNASQTSAGSGACPVVARSRTGTPGSEGNLESRDLHAVALGLSSGVERIDGGSPARGSELAPRSSRDRLRGRGGRDRRRGAGAGHRFGPSSLDLEGARGKVGFPPRNRSELHHLGPTRDRGYFERQ